VGPILHRNYSNSHQYQLFSFHASASDYPPNSFCFGPSVRACVQAWSYTINVGGL